MVWPQLRQPVDIHTTRRAVTYAHNAVWPQQVVHLLQRVVLCCNVWCYAATYGAMLQRVVLVATWFDTSAIAAHFTGTFQARYRHVTGTFEVLGNASVGTVDLLVVYLHERSMHRVHIRHIHADLEKQSHAAQCVFHSLDRCPVGSLSICTTITNDRGTMVIAVTGPNRPRHNALGSVESHLTAAMSRASGHTPARKQCALIVAHAMPTAMPCIRYRLIRSTHPVRQCPQSGSASCAVAQNSVVSE